MIRFKQVVVLGMMWVLLIATVAVAEEPESADDAVGVNIDMEFSTIYNFRGVNSFAEETAQDANGAWFPSITWSIGDTGLYLGYWGAYQLSGNNKREMVNGALGHEQDLYIGYDVGLGDAVTLSAAFTYFFYPFATENAAGSSNPSIVEPLVGISVDTPLDFGLNLSYFAGVSDGTEALSHLYINPFIGTSLGLGDYVSMDFSFGAGFKVWADEDVRDAGDNVVDIVFDAALPISVYGTDGLYVAPAIHGAWSNSEAGTFGDEYMVYASVNVGADF